MVGRKWGWGEYELLCACQSPFEEGVVWDLLDKGADPNTRDSFNDKTVLMYAALRGNVTKLNDLLSKGADLSARDLDGLTALMHASSKGHPEAVKALASRGGVDLETRYGLTALMVASQAGHATVVQALLTQGAKINGESGDASLERACREGHLDVVRILLAHGADVNARRRSGSEVKSQLELALFWKHPDIADLLRKAGAQ